MNFKIYKTKYWEIELCSNQYYVGRCIITLKRACGDLAELKNEEFLDLLNIIKNLENTIRKMFKATMFNWSCLMNDDYKAENPTPQVHFHVRPRYKSKVEINGEIFEDKEFAHHYNNEGKREVSQEILNEIIKRIKENLK